ncbi:MAG: penicillin-binding transpeptidase domain-containing protein [Deltaproteobacteria bacterium]|nr:penicillin-binding transpeptidase domain-containing protein [Deltaproteobacteria bacterium]
MIGKRRRKPLRIDGNSTTGPHGPIMVAPPDPSHNASVRAGRWTRMRIIIVGCMLGALGLKVAKTAYELQVDDSDRYKSLAEDNYMKEIELPPGRGRILDRNGKEFAATVEVESVFGNPRVLRFSPDAAARLAKVLSVPERQMRESLEHQTPNGRPRYFSWLKRRVTPVEAEAVRALALPGIGFRPEPRRFYPLRAVASTVIGYAGSDGRGLEGVELSYDKYLRGKTATLRGVKDALGRELLLDGIDDTSGVSGLDVTLSLDAYLSHVTRAALEKAMKEHNAQSATAVVLDPRTGDILAMADLPDFNPNQPATAVGKGARNRAITDTFEPGSTMKTFTFAAAFDEGGLSPTRMFDCENGRWKFGKYMIRDTHPLGVVTATEAYQQSSNICTVKIARQSSREVLFDYLRRFGFGQRTGVALPGERSGILRPVERWGEIGHATVAFGQGLTATPLQITAGFAVVAAGGVYRTPRLGLSVRHPDGSVELLGEKAPQGRPVMSPRAAAILVEVMAGVPTPQGTARLAAVPGYRVAGKTGTAQKVSGGAYDPDRWLASFVGFAPADDPRFVIGVFIDEPNPIHLGGKVAAPVFKEIAQAALQYLNIPPTQAVVAQEVEETIGPSGVAIAAVDVPEALGSTIVMVSAEEFFPIDSESPEAVQVDLVPIPDFSGLSVGLAIARASALHVELNIVGSGIAVAQSVAPDREVLAGTKVDVTFALGGR